MGGHLKKFLRRQKQIKRESEHEKYRLHDEVPWIESPLGAGAEANEFVFHQRHEANTLELCFDLFFVANLATFTAYHTVTDVNALLAYVGFFAVLWSTWFQITLHDVRFAGDSKYERMCKFGQMIAFVSFALVGSQFKVPSMKESVESAENKNFRVLCYTLVVSRVQMALQYGVVLSFTIQRGGYKRLVLPLSLNTAVYAVSAATFGAMSLAFLVGAQVSASIISLWWIVMFIEAACTIVISSVWRMLSFKATHLVERMGLLTLIVIGEGAIGVTKTVSKLMGKSDSLDMVACGQIICIVLILILLWALYFDNQPHGHYGTIKQQVWSLLHFPLHLGIVGTVEGAQQIAQARYIIKTVSKLTSGLYEYCVEEHLGGLQLQAKLNETIDYYQFGAKLETKALFDATISQEIRLLTSIEYHDVCNQANTTLLAGEIATRATYTDANGIPAAFDKLIIEVWTALFSSMGIKLDPKKLSTTEPSDIAWGSFETVYTYWWCSLAVVLICYMSFLYMIRTSKADMSDYIGQATRGVMVVACVTALGVTLNAEVLHATLGRPILLPLATCILAVVNFSDKLSRQAANKRILRENRPVSSYHTVVSHGKAAHYGPLDHCDPEKDPEIKGTLLKRRPEFEVEEVDEVSRPHTGYARPDSVYGQSLMHPRDTV